eukprot:CAMPEP_0198223678 /NCGR_PEP_ID=MMETSP1445-20131203/93534_1 /TAXON_ID=36898 /ORGANISM="Pyramimonas sp., Strain CCMP2087" /LENGTH=221 /DNA_ID=CAMNT_0043902587 /DNA_START=71 /DNA_END=732 /DNA_ORIENTATION=-
MRCALGRRAKPVSLAGQIRRSLSVMRFAHTITPNVLRNTFPRVNKSIQLRTPLQENVLHKTAEDGYLSSRTRGGYRTGACCVARHVGSDDITPCTSHASHPGQIPVATYTHPAGARPVPVAKLVLNVFPECILSPSISAARNFVRRGCIHVQGVQAVCASSVQPGDCVQVMQPTRSLVTDPAQRDPNNTPLKVVYEDACMAGVVKPQGLPMHGDATVPSLL